MARKTMGGEGDNWRKITTSDTLVSSGSSGGDERRSVVLVPKKASKRKASSKSRNTGLLAPNESSADGHSMEGTDWDDRRVSSSSGTPKRLSTGGNGKGRRTSRREAFDSDSGDESTECALRLSSRDEFSEISHRDGSVRSKKREKQRERSETSKKRRREWAGEDVGDDEHRRICTAINEVLQEFNDGELEDETAAGVLRMLSERLELLEHEKEGLVFFYMRQLGCEVKLGGASTEPDGNATAKASPGLSTACSSVASMVAPFSTSLGPMRSMGGGSSKLREMNLENPVIGAAYKMLLYDNASEDKSKVKAQFVDTFSRSFRAAKSKTAVAHRQAIGEVFHEILTTFGESDEAKGGILKILQGSLNGALLKVPEERWMTIATRGMAFVLKHHQRSLSASGDKRRLTVFDLIRGLEGANTLPNYTTKVLLPLANKVVSKFVAWVSAAAVRGTPPTPESLRLLGRQFVSELKSSDKGKKNSDSGSKREDGGGKGNASKKSWDVGNEGKILRSTFNDVLFEYMNDAFGGTGGTAVNALSRKSSIRDINAVLRPYLMPKANEGLRDEVQGGEKPVDAEDGDAADVKKDGGKKEVGDCILDGKKVEVANCMKDGHEKARDGKKYGGEEQAGDQESDGDEEEIEDSDEEEGSAPNT